MFSAPDQQRGPTPHDQTRPYLGTPCEKPPSPAWRSTACLRRRPLRSKLKRPKTHGDHPSQTHARRILRRKKKGHGAPSPSVRGSPSPGGDRDRNPSRRGLAPAYHSPSGWTHGGSGPRAPASVFSTLSSAPTTPPPSRPILRPVAPAGLHSTVKKYGNFWFWYGGLGEVTVGGYPPDVAAARSRRAGRIVRATDKSTF